MARTQPIGIELVKKGILTEADINKALDYQKEHPTKKLGDIINELDICDSDILINAIGDILGEKVINLKPTDVKLDILQYIPLDIAKRNKAVPFAVEGGRIKVCFPDSSNKRNIDSMRVLFLNKGLNCKADDLSELTNSKV